TMIALGWLHIHLFSQKPMQKSIINIKLIDRPLFASSNSNEQMYCNNFGNRRKPIRVINTFHLMVPFSNQSSLKAIHSSIRVKFNLVHPFGANGLFARRQWNKVPSAILLQSQ